MASLQEQQETEGGPAQNTRQRKVSGVTILNPNMAETKHGERFKGEFENVTITAEETSAMQTVKAASSQPFDDNSYVNQVLHNPNTPLRDSNTSKEKIKAQRKSVGEIVSTIEALSPYNSPVYKDDTLSKKTFKQVDDEVMLATPRSENRKRKKSLKSMADFSVHDKSSQEDSDSCVTSGAVFGGCNEMNLHRKGFFSSTSSLASSYAPAQEEWGDEQGRDRSVFLLENRAQQNTEHEMSESDNYEDKSLSDSENNKTVREGGKRSESETGETRDENGSMSNSNSQPNNEQLI